MADVGDKVDENYGDAYVGDGDDDDKGDDVGDNKHSQQSGLPALWCHRCLILGISTTYETLLT